MAATALIKLTQGSFVGADGEAIYGTVGTPVQIQNSDNTDVFEWTIRLSYVPPGSALVPGVLAQAVSPTPSGSYTPDVSGTYRLFLEVKDSLGNSNVDIRDVLIREPKHGFVRPPAQLLPEPLPVLGSGRPGEKPEEMNVGGQANGWSGRRGDGLGDDIVRRLDASTFDALPEPDEGLEGDVATVYTVGPITPLAAVAGGSEMWIADAELSGDPVDKTTFGRYSPVLKLAEFASDPSEDVRFVDGTYEPSEGAFWICGADSSTLDGLLWKLVRAPASLSAPSVVAAGDSARRLESGGGYLWFESGSAVRRVSPTSPGGPYSTIPFSGGLLVQIRFDPATANYSDSQPRLWISSFTGPSTIFVDRISLSSLTADATVSFSGSNATGIADGGGFIWVVGFDTSVQQTIWKIDPDPAALVTSSISINAVLVSTNAVVYEPVSGKLFVFGADSSNNPVLVRVNPATLAVEASVALNSLGNESGDILRLGVLDGYVWAPTGQEGHVYRVNPSTMAVQSVQSTNYLRYSAGSVPVFGTISQGSAGSGRLVDLDTTEVRDGQSVKVLSVDDYFDLDKSSSATADGIVVVAPLTGPGRWLRRSLGSVKWAEQASWEISSAGDDENTGGPGFPIRTFLEFRRRVAPIGQRTFQTITWLTDQVAGDKLLIDFHLAEGIDFVGGYAATVASGTFDTVTARVKTTNTPDQITDAGVPWGTYQGGGQTIVATSGAASGKISYVALDQGGGSARVTRWSDGVVIVFTPSAGDSYEVRRLVEIKASDLQLTSKSFVTFDRFWFSESLTAVSGSPQFKRCTFEELILAEPGEASLAACFISGQTTVKTSLSISAGGGSTGPVILAGSSNSTIGEFFIQGSFIVLQDGSSVDILGPGVFDSSVSGFEVKEFSSGHVASIWGSGNADFGLRMDTTSRCSYSSGSTNTATGTSGDVRVGNTTRTWASLPFVEGGNSFAGIIVRTP